MKCKKQTDFKMAHLCWGSWWSYQAQEVIHLGKKPHENGSKMLCHFPSTVCVGVDGEWWCFHGTIWFGYLITYFQDYSERSWGVPDSQCPRQQNSKYYFNCSNNYKKFAPLHLSLAFDPCGQRIINNFWNCLTLLSLNSLHILNSYLVQVLVSTLSTNSCIVCQYFSSIIDLLTVAWF